MSGKKNKNPQWFAMMGLSGLLPITRLPMGAFAWTAEETKAGIALIVFFVAAAVWICLMFGKK